LLSLKVAQDKKRRRNPSKRKSLIWPMRRILVLTFIGFGIRLLVKYKKYFIREVIFWTLLRII